MLVLDVAWLLAIGLLSVRLAVLFGLTPVFTSFPIPVAARVILTLMLSVVTAVALTASLREVPASAGELLAAAAAEFAVGLLMSIGVFVAFAAFAFAGRVLDIQIGYSVGQIYDPVSRAQVSVVTSGFMYLSVVLFFLLDVHHALLRVAAYTLHLVPVGVFSMGQVDIGSLITQSGKLFALGFMLIAPIAVCILLVEAGLGVVSRGLPQMNVFVIALPIKIVVGLLLLSLWATHLPAGMQRIYALTFDVWNKALR